MAAAGAGRAFASRAVTRPFLKPICMQFLFTLQWLLFLHSIIFLLLVAGGDSRRPTSIRFGPLCDLGCLLLRAGEIRPGQHLELGKVAPGPLPFAAPASAMDRLSALLDKLLRHVLSFLPSWQAMQTTMLSKRWVDQWRWVPAINIDFSDFRKVSNDWEEDWEWIEDFATNLLALHKAPCEVFRLNAHFVPSYLQPLVNAWIRRAIKDNPLVLQLFIICYDNGKHYYYQLPHLGSSSGRRIKRLDLYGVSLDDNFTEKLQSWFPDLEDLILRNCCSRFSCIHSDKLKNLVLKECKIQPTDVLVIRAPGLASLFLDVTFKPYRSGISLDAVNSLMKASITFPAIPWSPRSEAMLLGRLSNMTSLELMDFQPMAMLDEEFGKFPIFNNLRTLSLGSCFLDLNECHVHDVHASKALGRFLQNSPNLENLTLQNLQATLVTEPFEPPKLEDLRTLFLSWCSLHHDFRLLQHCLQRSPNLERLTLKYCKFSDDSTGGKTNANSKNTYSQRRNPVPLQCPKLKSIEIIYHGGHDNIPELVRFLLDSGCAPNNTITCTHMEKLSPESRSVFFVSDLCRIYWPQTVFRRIICCKCVHR